MRLKLIPVSSIAAILLLCFCGIATAQQQIAWGDFSGITNPAGGSAGPFQVDNAVGGGTMTFDVTFSQWDTAGDTSNYFASGGTTNDAYSWDDSGATSLIGFGDSAYSVFFDNISSGDGSLYLAAGALEDDNVLTISAFNSVGGALSLVGTQLVGEWETLGGGGVATWNPTATGGSLSTPGGGSSGLSTIINLSDLDISRLEFSYASASGGTVRTGDRWHVDIAANAVAAVPEPSSGLLLASLAGLVFVPRRRT